MESILEAVEPLERRPLCRGSASEIDDVKGRAGTGASSLSANTLTLVDEGGPGGAHAQEEEAPVSILSKIVYL